MNAYDIKNWAANEEKRKQKKQQQAEQKQQAEMRERYLIQIGEKKEMQPRAVKNSDNLLPANYMKVMIVIGVISVCALIINCVAAALFSGLRNIEALQAAIVLFGCLCLFGIAVSLFMFSIVPSVIAYNKGHTYKELITVFNVLLGGTIIGWILAFMFATDRTKHNN